MTGTEGKSAAKSAPEWIASWETFAPNRPGSLSGSVRVTVANRTLGPLELNGNPGRHEVDAWVNQHFPMDTNVFGDMERNEKRKDLIKTCLSEARMRLRQETEKHLPIRGVDICLLRSKDEKGASRFDVQVVHDYPGRQVDADRTLVSLRLQPDGSLRISTPAGKAAVLSRRRTSRTTAGWEKLAAR
jgi:hypothetical protein